MAEQGRKLDESTRRTLERLREAGRSIREAAKESGVAKSTAQKYLKKSA
jgi:IS30 family transposase